MQDDDLETPLTSREEAIAVRAAELAIERVYIEIGKTVVKKVFWIIGIFSIAVLVWLAGSEKLQK